MHPNSSLSPALSLQAPSPRRRRLRVLLALGLAVLLGACSDLYHYADPSKPHHLSDRFANWGGQLPQRQSAWYESITRRWAGDFEPEHPPAGGYAAFIEKWRVPLTTAALTPPADAGPRVVWLGHATVLLQVAGRNVLIDPQLSDFAGPLSWLASKRLVPAPITPEALPRIDVLLISHNHYDHLDLPTLQRMWAAGQRPRVLVPLGLKAWFDAQGLPGAEELDWWDQRSLGPLAITLLPAQHWSRRSLTDTNQTLWGGWAVEVMRPGVAAPWRFVHTGDTAWRPELHAEIARRLGGPVDLLALPIGAYEPRDFMRSEHIDPDEAVRIFQALQARQAFGIHWGTFALSREAFDQPPQDLAKALAAHQVPAANFWLLRQGEVRALP